MNGKVLFVLNLQPRCIIRQLLLKVRNECKTDYDVRKLMR